MPATAFEYDLFGTSGALSSHTGNSSQTYSIVAASNDNLYIESDNTLTNTTASSQSIVYNSVRATGSSVYMSWDLVVKSSESSSYLGTAVSNVTTGVSGYEFRYASSGADVQLYGFGTPWNPTGYSLLATYNCGALGVGTYHFEMLFATGVQKFWCNGSLWINNADTNITLSNPYIIFDAYSGSTFNITTGLAMKNFYAYNTNSQCIYAPDTSSLVLSPSNQYVNPGTSLQWIHTGTSMKLSVPGTTIGLQVTDSLLSAAGISSSNYPKIVYSLDNGPWHSAQLQTGGTQIMYITTFAPIYGHNAEIRFEPLDESDTWTPKSAMLVTGIVTDYGYYTGVAAPSSTSNAAQRSKTCLIDGDSITRGYDATSGGTYGYLCTQSFGMLVGHGLNAEVGIQAYSGQGVLKGATSVAPSYPNTYNKYDSTHSRSLGAPNYYLICQCTNDGGSTKQNIANEVQTCLTNARTAVGGVGSSTIIMWVAPFAAYSSSFGDTLSTSDGYNMASAVALGYQQYVAAYPNDTRTSYFDGSALHYGLRETTNTQYSTTNSGYQIHPDLEGHALQAADVVSAIRYFEGTLTAPSGSSFLSAGILG